MPDPNDTQTPPEDENTGDAAATEAAQPSTEDLASELNELEKAAETATEAAPGSEEAPDAPAATEATAETEAAPSETETPPDAPPASSDETKTPPDDTAADKPEPEADRTIAPPVSVQVGKKAADKTRREALIAARPEPDMSIYEAEEERKAVLMEELAEVQAEQAEAEDAVEACRVRTRELMGELYPHTAKSDKLVDAVRGHIAAQKKVRAYRASSPERIKAILEQAGKAPIDAAFHRQRARGMARPTRTPMRPGGAAEKPAVDKGDGSKANAGQD